MRAVPILFHTGFIGNVQNAQNEFEKVFYLIEQIRAKFLDSYYSGAYT